MRKSVVLDDEEQTALAELTEPSDKSRTALIVEAEHALPNGPAAAR
ncbi:MULTISPECIES: hypothetical protein [unclassified Frankia]|nr:MULTISPECIES: hypothetical protein [unclassified Frankia]